MLGCVVAAKGLPAMIAAAQNVGIGSAIFGASLEVIRTTGEGLRGE